MVRQEPNQKMPFTVTITIHQIPCTNIGSKWLVDCCPPSRKAHRELCCVAPLVVERFIDISKQQLICSTTFRNLDPAVPKEFTTPFVWCNTLGYPPQFRKQNTVNRFTKGVKHGSRGYYRDYPRFQSMKELISDTVLARQGNILVPLIY